MLHQTVLPIPTNPPTHLHPVPEQTTTSTDHPLGRYCGHVFLYWEVDHFLKQPENNMQIQLNSPIR